MSETTAHLALAEFLTRFQGRLPALAFVWHTANESAGGAKISIKDARGRPRQVPVDVLKEASMGARAGVWDWLYIGRCQSPNLPDYLGVAIELKSDKAYKSENQGLSPEQRAWQIHYRSCGWLTAVYPESRWQDAALLIVEYCGGDPADFRFYFTPARETPDRQPV